MGGPRPGGAGPAPRARICRADARAIPARSPLGTENSAPKRRVCERGLTPLALTSFPDRLMARQKVLARGEWAASWAVVPAAAAAFPAGGRLRPRAGPTI